MTMEIRQRLDAAPFLPFAIRTTDGQRYEVPSPDHAHVHPNGVRVSVYTDDGREHILPSLHLSGIEIHLADLAGS